MGCGLIGEDIEEAGGGGGGRGLSLLHLVLYCPEPPIIQ